MDANRLTLPWESFDAVWVIECSEHLADKRRFVGAFDNLRRAYAEGIMAYGLFTAWKA